MGALRHARCLLYKQPLNGSGVSSYGPLLPAATKPASRRGAASSSSQENPVRDAKTFEQKPPGGVPKPYTTPEGYIPPSLAEQWKYAMKNHPYARNGGAAALLVGLFAYGASRLDTSKSRSSDKDAKEVQRQ